MSPVAVLQHGVGAGDLAILAQRVMLGGFFVLARFRFFYDPVAPRLAAGDPSRHQRCFLNPTRYESLRHKVCDVCHYPPCHVLVAVVEVAAGLALIVGLLAVPAAFGLAIIILFGTLCTWRERTARQNPCDGIDWVSCYLWLPEPFYLLLAISLVLTGPGKYALDALL
jgi:uncharacterized membrane protein YphA (DoxX/SURF4 family)